MPERPIALVGLMGAGKSAVARILAARLGGVALDLDEIVEAEAARSVAEIFVAEGEGGFRSRESKALVTALEGGPTVLACGGGIILDPANRERLSRSCRVVWLEVTPEEAFRRLGPVRATRPLLGDGPEGLVAMLDRRAPLYAGVAELRVATDAMSPEQVAAAVMAGLGPSLKRASA